MNRTDEMNALGAALMRLCELGRAEDNAVPTKEDLTRIIASLQGQISESEKLRDAQGDALLTTLWHILRSLPGKHAIIKPKDQQTADPYTCQVLRVDDNNGNVHLIAIDAENDNGQIVDFSGITDDMLSGGDGFVFDAGRRLFQEWKTRKPGTEGAQSVNEDFVRSVVDDRFGEGTYDRMVSASASPVPTSVDEVFKADGTFKDEEADRLMKGAMQSTADTEGESPALEFTDGGVGPDVKPRKDLADYTEAPKRSIPRFPTVQDDDKNDGSSE